MNKANEIFLTSALFFAGIFIYFLGVSEKMSPMLLLGALAITSIACWKAGRLTIAKLTVARQRHR